MAIPGDGLFKFTLDKVTYLNPDDLPYEELVDYELGGFALQNTSAGLNHQVWKMTYDTATSNIILTDANDVSTTIATKPNIAELAFSFDRNMNVVYAYRQTTAANEGVFINFFDTATNAYKDLALGAGHSPVVCHDDKRESSAATSDVIIGYVRGSDNKFITFTQRDRYAIPTEQFTVPSDKKLVRMGMSTENRLSCTFRKTSVMGEDSLILTETGEPIVSGIGTVIMKENT